jgi:hypothetical protein
LSAAFVLAINPDIFDRPLAGLINGFAGRSAFFDRSTFIVFSSPTSSGAALVALVWSCWFDTFDPESRSHKPDCRVAAEVALLKWARFSLAIRLPRLPVTYDGQQALFGIDSVDHPELASTVADKLGSGEPTNQSAQAKSASRNPMVAVDCVWNRSRYRVINSAQFCGIGAVLPSSKPESSSGDLDGNNLHCDGYL